MRQEDDAGHEGDHGEAAHAEAGHDAGDDDDEGAGGSADLGAEPPRAEMRKPATTAV